MMQYNKMTLVAFTLGLNLAGTAASFQQVLTLTHEAAELKGELAAMQKIIEVTDEGDDYDGDEGEEMANEEDTDTQVSTDENEDRDGDDSASTEEDEIETLMFQGQIAGDGNNLEEI